MQEQLVEDNKHTNKRLDTQIFIDLLVNFFLDLICIILSFVELLLECCYSLFQLFELFLVRCRFANAFLLGLYYKQKHRMYAFNLKSMRINIREIEAPTPVWLLNIASKSLSFHYLDLRLVSKHQQQHVQDDKS